MIDFNEYQIAYDEYPEYAEVIEYSQSQWASVPKTGKVVVVNIPAAEVWLMENGIRTGFLNAIVGKPAHQTPVMSDDIKYIELNPKWYVPKGIAKRDLVPKMLSRPEIVEKYGFKFYTKEWEKLEYSDINWSEVEPLNWNYRIVQEPGWANAMGQIKFMFPNDLNIYLHDTPDKTLFKLPRYRRKLSSGCVRVENPLNLASFLTGKSLRSRLLKRDPEDKVKLESPVPIRILYMPIWVDSHLDVNFSYDIYNKFQNYHNPEDPKNAKQ